MVTIKQKTAVKIAVENGGNISKAMREAKYSPETAKNPSKLTESKGWQELMKQHLPDKLIAKKHKQLLNKEGVIVKNNNKTGEIEVVKTGELDVQAVSKGLEMAYKLKGKYAPEKHEFTGLIGILGSVKESEKEPIKE